MPKKAIDILKSFFETGDRPTQEQFADLIDSFHHKDGAALISSKSYDPQTGAVNIQFTDNSSLNFTIPKTLTIDQIVNLQNELDNKVDKVAGKGLSANDFTNYFKNLLSSAGSHINDTDAHVSAQDRATWNNKVSPEAGKGLSTNDYDDDEIQKVQDATEHINDDTRHLTPESVASFTENLREYKVGEFIGESQTNVHRIFENEIYKFDGLGDPEDPSDDATYPFECADFAAELAAGRWVLVMSAEDANNLIVRVKDQEQILNKVLDSTKLYSLETNIDNTDTSKSIIVPADGLTIRGFGFNTTTVKCGAGCTLFTSASGGSGDLVMQDFTAMAVGTGAKVFDIEDTDESHAVEIEYVNFVACNSLGTIKDYRQGTATTVGVYGCQDGIELAGNWSGFKVSNTNIFGFGSAGTLFKKGVDLLFTNRFFLNVNIDFPTGAKLCDFEDANFASNELMQINSSIAKVEGIIDIDNTENLVPNISANSLKSLWVGNIGLPDSATEALTEDSTVSGAYVIDWLKDTYFLTMTSDTTFTEKNLPASTKNTQEIKIYLTGDFTPTFPNDWFVNSVGSYNGIEVNEITVKYIKSGLYFVRISNSFSVYPKPFITSVEPSGILPNQTKQFTIDGLYLTPATSIKVGDLTVNTKTFVSPERVQISLTAGSNEGSFDLVANNGTAAIAQGAILVNSGTVVVPQAVDLINRVNVNVSNGNIANNNINSNGAAEWSRIIPPAQLFTLQFRATINALKFEAGGSNNIAFYRNSDNVLLRRWDISRNTNNTSYFLGNINGGNYGDYTPNPNIIYRQTSSAVELLDENGNILFTRAGTPLNTDYYIVFKSDNMNFEDIRFIEQ